MNENNFYFNTADEVLAEVNKVLATLKANGVITGSDPLIG